MKFLGHLVGSGQHSPDPERAEVMERLARPTMKKEVRSLLGLADYYCDYISQLSKIRLPLTKQTRRYVPNTIPWNVDTDQAFTKLIKYITQTIRSPGQFFVLALTESHRTLREL